MGDGKLVGFLCIVHDRKRFDFSGFEVGRALVSLIAFLFWMRYQQNWEMYGRSPSWL
jgi:hypothetical protein